MRYLVLACDYDGTIAHNGRVDDTTIAALERARASGRKVLLVTGREMEDLKTVFTRFDLFDLVVGENGALIYHPATHEVRLLAPPPPPEFVQRLKERNVWPMSVGHGIVATWEPHENAVLDTIRALGLELQVIFNKGAVMVLPSGVNKASGLSAALKELHLSPHNVVGVGDAENDHAFLAICECAVAVANALPNLKERVDIVTPSDHGKGVAELIDELLADDLRQRQSKTTRHRLRLGVCDDGSDAFLSPYGQSLLIAGPSASGKSTIATAIMERLADRRYQFCVIDPEGDYGGLEPALHLGGPQRGPSATEILEALQTPKQNVVVSLVGLALRERPPFFRDLLPRLQELRAKTARPHWLIIDEAHHLLPVAWESASLAIPQLFEQALLVTVHPEEVAPAILQTVSTLIAVGQAPDDTFLRFCRALQLHPPQLPQVELRPGEVILWHRDGQDLPQRIKVDPAKAERRRHRRKYAEGELPPERSFFFRGPQGKLNLRAQNLFLFLQIAEGVDDETWLFHLRQSDISKWFRKELKDEELATDASAIEADMSLGAGESRARVRAAVEGHYTLPTSTPTPQPAEVK